MMTKTKNQMLYEYDINNIYYDVNGIYPEMYLRKNGKNYKVLAKKFLADPRQYIELGSNHNLDYYMKEDILSDPQLEIKEACEKYARFKKIDKRTMQRYFKLAQKLDIHKPCLLWINKPEKKDALSGWVRQGQQPELLNLNNQMQPYHLFSSVEEAKRFVFSNNHMIEYNNYHIIVMP